MIPVMVQGFPTQSVILSNSITFATYTVTIVGSLLGPGAYSPDTITISTTDFVVWHNSAPFGHSATCGSGTTCGTWDTGLFSSGYSTPIAGTSFSPGTTGYYCSFHGYPSMYGAVIRTEPNGVDDWKVMAQTNKEMPVTQGPFWIVFTSQNDLGKAQPSSTKTISPKKLKFNTGGTLEISMGVSR